MTLGSVKQPNPALRNWKQERPIQSIIDYQTFRVTGSARLPTFVGRFYACPMRLVTPLDREWLRVKTPASVAR